MDKTKNINKKGSEKRMAFSQGKTLEIGKKGSEKRMALSQGKSFEIGKKGSEKYLSIWWFFVLVIILVGIVTGVLVFYSVDLDLKSYEAKYLSERLVSCFSEKGQTYYSGEFDIYQKCGIRKEVFDKGSNFFYRIQILDENGEIIKEFSDGQISYENDCAVLGKIQSENNQQGNEIKAQHYPACMERTALINYNSGNGIKKGSISVVAGSNQAGVHGVVV
jgi:hypothetical protein